MKAFMEEYGFTILSVVIITILIIMATPIGEKVSQRTKELVLGKTIENIEKEKNSNNSNATINISMDASENIKIEVPVRIAGSYTIEYSVKHEGLWSTWIGTDFFKADKAETKIFTKTINDLRSYRCGKGDYIKFRVKSSQMETDSNILKCSN